MGYGTELTVESTEKYLGTTKSITSSFPKELTKEMVSMMINFVTTEMAPGPGDNTLTPYSSDLINSTMPLDDNVAMNMPSYERGGKMENIPNFSSGPLLTPLLLMVAVTILLLSSEYQAFCYVIENFEFKCPASQEFQLSATG
jgi:hypothetical protein